MRPHLNRITGLVFFVFCFAATVAFIHFVLESPNTSQQSLPSRYRRSFDPTLNDPIALAEPPLLQVRRRAAFISSTTGDLRRRDSPPRTIRGLLRQFRRAPFYRQQGYDRLVGQCLGCRTREAQWIRRLHTSTSQRAIRGCQGQLWWVRRTNRTGPISQTRRGSAQSWPPRTSTSLNWTCPVFRLHGRSSGDTLSGYLRGAVSHFRIAALVVSGKMLWKPLAVME